MQLYFAHDKKLNEGFEIQALKLRMVNQVDEQSVLVFQTLLGNGSYTLHVTGTGTGTGNGMSRSRSRAVCMISMNRNFTIIRLPIFGAI